jgi:hypothetical protein
MSQRTQGILWFVLAMIILSFVLQYCGWKLEQDDLDKIPDAIHY